jgi:N-acetylglucosamine kinase-like BadF-type ATPase
MILIADSGSTKTDWKLINAQKEVRNFQTIGFNPYFIDSKNIEKILRKDLIPKIDCISVKKLYYYGAGCSSKQKYDIVAKALNNIFVNADVIVEHDLLGASRALCGRSEAIVCILGTGSSSGYYDGKNIIENMPLFGYMFGDEGSGAQFGKILINAYLKNELPTEIKNAFYKKYKLSNEYILDCVYNRSYPNRFLASFGMFFSENIKNPYIYNIVESCFESFFYYQICRYSNYKSVPVNCVGSIAFYFKEILKKVAKKNNVIIKKIVKSPIQGLMEYHKP